VGLAAVALVAATCLAPGPAPGQAPQRDPQRDAAVMLVRNTLTALNHGNLTGNYTVLRDLGGPVFRERNSAAQLAAIFQRLRDQKTDLSPILVLEPVFTEAPAINQGGQLQVAGFFPTQPLHVQFRLAFQRLPAGWMIDAVTVSTIAAQAPPQNAGNSMPQPADGPPANFAARPQERYTR
jgi:hypothetical protein